MHHEVRSFFDCTLKYRLRIAPYETSRFSSKYARQQHQANTTSLAQWTLSCSSHEVSERIYSMTFRPVRDDTKIHSGAIIMLFADQMTIQGRNVNRHTK